MMVVYVGLEEVVEGGVVVVAELKKIQFRQGFTDVRAFAVIRSSEVRPFPVVRSLGENRARDELRDFGEKENVEVEIE